MANIFHVVFSKNAQKDLLSIPKQCRDKLEVWILTIETIGLRKTRELKGFHDEPLKGNRQGQRSVRLNSSYRAIYTEKSNGEIEFICIEEVNKHKY